jgi:aspartate aminotransferase
MSFINSRTQLLKPSATLLINQKINNLRSEGKTIYHFGFGQSPFPVPKRIVGELIKHADCNQYLPTLGLPELQKEIAGFLKSYQNIDSDESSILIGPGSKELLFQTILMLDGTYLIPKGSWVSYLPQITLNNKEFAVLETSFDDNYKLQAHTLEVYCKKATSENNLLILNSPNNPTGAVYTEEELTDLAEVCRAYDITVLSDEIYSQLSYQVPYATSISNYYPGKTLVFGGLSKVFSAGGYRLGYLSIPSELHYLKTTYKSLFSETFSAVSAPIQYAAIEAYKFEKEVKDSVEDSKEILHMLGNYVYDTLSSDNIKCTSPQGGFYILVDFSYYKDQLSSLDINDSVSLGIHLLDKYSVALLPGVDFYFSPNEFIFRLAYVDFNGKTALAEYQKNKNIPLDLKFIKTFAPNIFNGVQKILEFVKTFE